MPAPQRSLRSRLEQILSPSSPEAPSSESDRQAVRARLEKLLRQPQSRPSVPEPPCVPTGPKGLDALAEAIGGRLTRTAQGRVLHTEFTYPGSHRHGRAGLEPVRAHLAASVPLLTARGVPARREGLPPLGRWVLLDTETTGLAGGTGTIAFLVGLARFDGAKFRVTQHLIPHPADERALLDVIEEELDGAEALVTYNGKAFDVPLLETRRTLHRLGALFADHLHLDLLFAARRLWRYVHEDCRLATLENRLLGFRRHGDIPGSEIPTAYFHFLRTGSPALLAPVVRHNRDDLLSLAALWGHVLSLLAGARKPASGWEHYGLAGIESSDPAADARGRLEEAAATGNLECRARALRSLSIESRRRRDWPSAANGLRALADLAHPLRWWAAEAYAICLERRMRRPAEALEFLLRWPGLSAAPEPWWGAFKRRIERLEWGLGSRSRR